MDWGTRRKPLGAIVAWGSLAVFAVSAILGIAGLVMGLQQRPAPALVETAIAAPEPAPVEERLPEDLSFAEAAAENAVPAATPLPAGQAVAAAEVAPASDPASAMIASTFEQLVQPVILPASEVPQNAIVTGAQPATEPAATAVPPAVIDTASATPAKPRAVVGRNAAAWAIESEVPDGTGSTSALGYAAQPDETVRVGDSAINVRSGPSPTNKRLFTLPAGARVDVTGRVTGKSGDWVAVTDDRDRDGWVDASLLDNLDLGVVPVVSNPPPVEAAPPAKRTSLKKVASSGVTVRSGPAKGNKALFNLSGGAEVSVLDESKGWLKVKDAQGRTGWAYKTYIKG